LDEEGFFSVPGIPIPGASIKISLLKKTRNSFFWIFQQKPQLEGWGSLFSEL